MCFSSQIFCDAFSGSLKCFVLTLMKFYEASDAVDANKLLLFFGFVLWLGNRVKSHSILDHSTRASQTSLKDLLKTSLYSDRFS